MLFKQFSPARCAPLVVLCSLAIVFVACRPPAAMAKDYTIESPEVQQMIKRGVNYLENGLNNPGGVGYEILMGYTVFKATESTESRLVQRGITGALSVVDSLGTENTMEPQHEFNYLMSVAAQLLAAVDPIKYQDRLQKILDYYKKRQRPDGAFGYNHAPYNAMGDVSQTQYVLLALWSLDHADLDVPVDMVERAFKWLTEAQDAQGGWPYQYPAGNQYPPTHVMTAVGMSAVMIAGDVMGVLRGGGGSAMAATEEAERNAELGVPVAFRRVIEQTGPKATVDQSAVSASAARGKQWLDRFTYRRVPAETWHYYYLYSIERYEAFFEAMNGRREKSPQWYNNIVEELLKLQNKDGIWGQSDIDAGSAHSCTCFAILCLLRTTQKSIGELSEGVALGGYGGLKADMSAVQMQGGKVEDKQEVTDIEQALSMLSASTDNKTAANLANRIRLDEDPRKRNQQLETFARLLRGGDAAQRVIAAKVLGRGDDLDMVPALIYALSDPDASVARYAENSLRILSRQLETYKIPLGSDITAAHRLEAQKYWQQWYQTVRPDFVFLNAN